jgi:RND family efflux transporter MFP subunit
MMRRKYRLLITLFIGLGISVSCSKPSDTQQKSVESKPSLSVTLITPTLQDIPFKINANGSIAAWHEAIISAEVSELRLTKVNVEVGDLVKKDQVLAVFSDESVLTDVAQSRAALNEAEANLAEATINATRATQVSTSGALSSQQIDQFFTTEKTALAKVDSAKAKLDAQLLRLKYTKVVASDDGVISSRSATLGAVTTKGQELFRLIRENRLEWRGEVMASEMVKLKPKMTVNLEWPNVGNHVEGTIRAIAPTIDEKSRYGLIYVDVPQAASYGLRAGMFARGEFDLGHSSALTLPQSALVQREGFSYVFKVSEIKNEETAKVSQLKVQLGRRAADNIEITAGLNIDDVIVANGASFLADNDTVRVIKP